MTANAGIDYSLGRSNVNRETGIHYGVISQHSLNPDVVSDFEPDYGEPHCPKCGNRATDATEFAMEYPEVNTEEFGTTEHGCADYVCETCKEFFDSSECFPDESQGFSYEQDGYKLTDCLRSDVFVLDSPYYTFAQYCSPCVPGAGNLDTPCESGPKTYCLGHEFFDGGKAPYTVYSVKDGMEVTPDTD